MKIAVFATHPVQYHIPWFRELSRRDELDVRVYFACIPGAGDQGTGFDVAFTWDIPMYEGYTWEVLENWKHTPRIDGFFASRIKGARQILQRDNPDVVVLTGWQALPLLQVLFYCIRLKIPRIVRGESNGMKPRNWKVRMVHKLLLPLYNSFLAIGRANRQFYREYGIPANMIFSCPYFVENSRLLEQVESIKQERELLRAEWNIAGNAVCFLYVGKLIAKKRIQDQLAALELALAKQPDLHLLVVGSGELLQTARQTAEEKPLPVTFAGFLNQTEITRAYCAADCLILSSDYDETWGLVVNEAMVCGLPAIVSDRAGCGPDLIVEGETGFLYPFADVQNLADRMLVMARDRDRLQAMGAKAKERILSEYTVEQSVNGVIAAAEMLLS